MRSAVGWLMLARVTLRFLAPANPVIEGRSALVRARLGTSGTGPLTTRWDWDDGQPEEAVTDAVVDRYARRSHRYAAPGVYLVRVGLEGPGPTTSAPEAPSARYVTVRAADQLAACGWVRDEHSGARVPFGFLVVRGPRGRDAIVFRCLVEGGEVRATSLSWIMVDPPGSLHLGGAARYGKPTRSHRYRIDMQPLPGGHLAQHLTLSLYPPHGVPGRDSPSLRVSGPIRPGRSAWPLM